MAGKEDLIDKRRAEELARLGRREPTPAGRPTWNCPLWPRCAVLEQIHRSRRAPLATTPRASHPFVRDRNAGESRRYPVVSVKGLCERSAASRPSAGRRMLCRRRANRLRRGAVARAPSQPPPSLGLSYDGQSPASESIPRWPDQACLASHLESLNTPWMTIYRSTCPSAARHMRRRRSS